MSASTTSDVEGTRIYPVIAILDTASHAAALHIAAAAAGEAPPSASSAAAPPSAGEERGNVRPVASPSAWLLDPTALSAHVIPSLAASLSGGGSGGTAGAGGGGGAGAAAAGAGSSGATVPPASSNVPRADVILLTREELESAAPKKKGSKDSASSAAAKKKKGGAEELSAEEAYEAAHFSLSKELAEAIRDRIAAELATARDALIERRRLEIEAADPAFVADPKKSKAKKSASGAAASAAGGNAAAAAAALQKKPGTPASGAKSGSNKKSTGGDSGRNSARGSRSASPYASKPGTPSGHGRRSSTDAEAANPNGVRYPTSLPLHFILFDLVRTVGDAARLQEIVGHQLDVFVRLQDPAMVEAAALASQAASEADAREFLYGSPTGSTEGEAPLSTVEVRLAREAREEAVARAPVPRPHPHDQTVYGIHAPPAAPTDAAPGSLLAALVDAQTQQRAAQASGGSIAPAASFRNLVFLPVVLPTATSAPTLGVSIAAPVESPAAGSIGGVPASPPTSARKVGSGAGAAPLGSGEGKVPPSSASKDAAKKRATGKGAPAEVVAPPTAEQELVARLNQELLLALREFSQARAEYTAWGSVASVKALPLAPAPLSTVDTRLYSHLLRQLPASTIDIPTMLHAMFEQVAVHAPLASAPAANTAAAPPAADLNDFFAGSKLDEIDQFMSDTLAKITFNANNSSNAAASAGSWIDKPRALTPCPSSLGGRHNFDSNGVPQEQLACRACGATEASLALLSPVSGAHPGSSSAFIKYGDDLAVRRAEAALALGLPAQADSLTAAAEALLADRWPLPGVGRRGMPATLDEASLAAQGAEATALLSRATGAPNSGKLSAAVFERALLLLELEEMLLLPAPAFKHTLHAALDPSQESEREVRVVPAGSAAYGAALQTPAVPSQTVREASEGFSLYHVAHARADSATVEAAVGARLRELHAEAKRAALAGNGAVASGAGPLTAGFGYGFGLRDESDAGEERCKWALESREYQEELSARVLPQRLLQAMHSPSESAHTQVRYRPLFDELLVAVGVPVPLTRQRSAQWASFLTPNLSLQAWLAAGPPVQRAPRPRVLYSFADSSHSGKLAQRIDTFFPLDQARLALLTAQVGDVARAIVMLEKDGLVITLEKAPIETNEEEDSSSNSSSSKASEQPAASTNATSEVAPEEVQEEKTGSRPNSRGGEVSARDSSRKGSAGRERSASHKKASSAVAGTGATGAAIGTPGSASKRPAGALGVAPKSASTKKKAAQEQKEAEDAAALLAAQQADAEAAARQVLAAQEAALARLRAPPKLPRESIVLCARLANGSRFAVSGARGDGSNRATFTARSGLVLEVRGAADDVYLAYPRSVLDGGSAQPLVPNRKHGVPASVDAAAAAADAGDVSTSASASTAAAPSTFAVPPAAVPSFDTETFRSVSPSGVVYRVHRDGSAWLLLPNGHVAYRAPQADASPAAASHTAAWVWTDNTGARWGRLQGGAGERVQLPGMQVAQQFDAESGASVWTRADQTMFIRYADGSSLAQHADGTRIYVDDLSAQADEQAQSTIGSVSVSAARRRVVVEHPRFPPLTFAHHLRTTLREARADADDQHAQQAYAAGVSAGVLRQSVVQLSVEFPADGISIAKHALTDALTLHARSGEDFVVLPQGRVLFVPASFSRSRLPADFLQGSVVADAALPKHVYELDLSFASSGRLSVADEEDNLFRISCAGVADMELGRERNMSSSSSGYGGRGAAPRDSIPPAYYPLPANPVQPHLFVVRGDGSGFELLHTDAVNAFLTEASADPHTRAMQPESFADANADGERQSVAVSMKYLQTLVPPSPYVRHPVVPNVVRAAPSGLAAGSSLAVLDATDPLEVLRAEAQQARAVAGVAPPSLVYRHLINTPVVTPAQKARAAAERTAFADWKEARREAECAYERDAARGDGGEGAEAERAEAQRVQEEVARARANLDARKSKHASALVSHEQSALSEASGGSSSRRSGSAASSRPSTVNAHRQPSSQHLLPRPLHGGEEAQRVVEQMVQTLQQPPKPFFAAAKAGKSANATTPSKQKKERPPSASTVGQPPPSFNSFFAQPAFRRDFLLSTLLQRLTDLAAPYIPGSRVREEESAAADGEQAQTAAEKEELWASLDETARAQYQQQFVSQLSLLVANSLSFAEAASAFLSAPYDASRRQLSLQQEPFVSLLSRGHPSFRLVVDVLASALGYERDSDVYLLAVGNDEEFRDNLAALQAAMRELAEGAASEAAADGLSPSTAPTSPAAEKKANGSTHAQKKQQQRSQLRAAAEEKEQADADAAQQQLQQAGNWSEYEEGVDYEAMVANLSAKERARFTSTPAYQQYLAREARLKQIPSTYSTQQHASHGASFKFTSPYAPHQPHLPPNPVRTALPANAAPTAFDVTGAPRRTANRVSLPAALGPSAPAQLNQKHLLAELKAGQPRPSPKTASTVRQSWHSNTASFASFVLQPAALDLGALRKGCTYRVGVTLTNVGSVTGRFQVIQPSEERADLVHMRVLYRPGLVAPGLQRRLEVELYAGSVGALNEQIEVRSEQHIFTLPVRADILSDSEYARHTEAGGAVTSHATLSSTVGSVHAPQLQATYERDFPASPLRHAPAGPFTLTSSFAQTSNVSAKHFSPAHAASASKPSARSSNGKDALNSTVPRAHFGQTGEVRLLSPTATPHVAQALQKQQQAHTSNRKQQAQDASEL